MDCQFLQSGVTSASSALLWILFSSPAIFLRVIGYQLNLFLICQAIMILLHDVTLEVLLHNRCPALDLVSSSAIFLRNWISTEFTSPDMRRYSGDASTPLRLVTPCSRPMGIVITYYGPSELPLHFMYNMRYRVIC